MGGSSRSSTTTQYSPAQEELMRLQTTTASGLAPDMQRLLMGVLGGDPTSAIAPYLASTALPYEQQKQRVAEDVMRATPAGGRQSALLGKAFTDVGIARAGEQSRQSQDYYRLLLNMAAQLFGARPSPMGQTSTQSQPARFGFSLGPFAAQF